MNKFLLIIILCINTPRIGFSQINPIGVAVTIDGNIRIFDWENSVNEQFANDSLTFEFDSKKHHVGIAEFERDYLFLIESPNPDWTNYGIRNDYDRIYQMPYPIVTWNIDLPINLDSFTNAKEVQENSHFENIIKANGDTLPDSLIDKLRTRLNYYIKQNANKNCLSVYYDLSKILHNEFSEIDTVIDGEEYYDFNFLIDKLVFFAYSGDTLTEVMGYFHGNVAPEFDSLDYNSNGQLVYFQRKKIGIAGQELFLKYDVFGRVSSSKHYLYGHHSEYYDPCPCCRYNSVIVEQEYAYNEDGMMESIIHSFDGEQNITNITYYMIK